MAADNTRGAWNPGEHDAECEIESGAVGYDGLYCDCAQRAAAKTKGARERRGLAFGVYEVVVNYLQATGWRRERLGSGWWWKDGCEEEATLGGALEQQLDLDGIDQRDAVPGEVEEFWG